MEIFLPDGRKQGGKGKRGEGMDLPSFAISINGDRSHFTLPLILCFATLWPGRAGEFWGISLVFCLINKNDQIRSDFNAKTSNFARLTEKHYFTNNISSVCSSQ